jgi:hypothetical protein
MNTVVREILRMSQKAMACTLALVGVGYIGGLIAIFFKPELAEPLERYASIFTPVWQVEIGVYGLGSTIEKLPNLKSKVTEKNESNG